MKNHWLIDDQATRQEIHDYVKTSWAKMGFEDVPMTADQLDYCIEHAVRHITYEDVNLTNCFAAKEENQLPLDTALIVAKYYRELKYRNIDKKDKMGTACTPAHDWVVMYFSKDHEKWNETLGALKSGALCCSYVLLHNTLPEKHPNFVSRETAEFVWDHWKQTFSKK